MGKDYTSKSNLQYLLYTTKEMAGIEGVHDLLKLCLERLSNVFTDWGFAVIIEDAARPSVLTTKIKLNIEEKYWEYILQKHVQITMHAKQVAENAGGDYITFLDDDPTLESNQEKVEEEEEEEELVDQGQVAGWDKEEVTTWFREGVSENDNNKEWIVVDGEIGDNDRLRIFITHEELDHTNLQLIRLFISLASALVHNTILRRELRRRSQIDALTGAFNRAHLDERLSELRKEDHRLDPYSVLFFDVNGLKRVNDVFGHLAGDELIKSSVNFLQSSSRDTDDVFRPGGDELVMVCRQTGANAAAALVKRLKQAMTKTKVNYHNPTTNERETDVIKISVGYASSDQHDNAKLLDIADQEMMKDKENFYNEEKNKRYR